MTDLARRTGAWLVSAALLATACTPTAAPEPPPPSAPIEPTVVDGPGVERILAAIDDTVDPCDDFYAWACGGWHQTVALPDEPGARATLVLDARERDREQRTVALLDELAAAPSTHADLATAGRFYAACLDVDAIEARGAEPIRPWLERAAGLRSVGDLLALSGELDRVDATLLFGSWVRPAARDPERAVLHVTLDGLGLPDPSLYWLAGDAADALRAAYVDDLATLFALVDVAPERARADADAVLALERRIARILVREDVTGAPVALAQLERDSGLDWPRWLGGLGVTLPASTEVVAPSLEVLADIGELLDETHVDALRAWASARILLAMAPRLSSPFRAVHEGLRERLTGTPTRTTRKLACAALTSWALEGAVARAWRAAEPSHDVSSAASVEVVDAVREQLAERTGRARYLDATTRAVALDQLDALVVDVGAAGPTRTYDALAGTLPDTWFEAHARVLDHEARAWLELLTSGVAADELALWWSSTSPTGVAIEWEPALQRLRVGAAARVDPELPAPARFGGFGMRVGLALAGIVDPRWMAPAASVVERHETQLACFEVRMGRYEGADGAPLDGRALRDVAMADAAGLDLAWGAYRAWRERAGRVETAAALDDAQVFFAAFGQQGCVAQSPALARYRAEQLGEPPARVRVNAAAANSAAFQAAFGCGLDARMRDPLSCGPW